MDQSEAEDFVNDIIERTSPRFLVVSSEVFRSLLPGENPTRSIAYRGVQIDRDSSLGIYEYACDPEDDRPDSG